MSASRPLQTTSRMPNFREAWLLIFGGVMGFALGGSFVSSSMTSDLNSIEQLLRMVSFIATPIVAVAAVFIARRQAETAQQQTRVNERKYDADLYDRRLRIYEETRRVMGVALRQGDVPLEDFLRFQVNIADADFLFGDDVVSYLNVFRQRCVDLGMWNDEFRTPAESRPPDFDLQKVIKEKYAASRWIIEQHEPAKALFRKYLHLARP